MSPGVVTRSRYAERKSLVVTLLWVGAILAIVGLWFPNWVRALAGSEAPLFGFALFKTPVLTYVGAIVLWLGCLLGVWGMGKHSRYVFWLGISTVVAAIISWVLALVGVLPSAVLLFVGIAAFLATLFIYWTFDKVEEIIQDKVVGRVKRVVLGMNFVAIILGVSAVVVGLFSIGYMVPLIYATVAAYTLTWLIAGIGIYRYQTEKRLAGEFAAQPEEQVW